MKQLLIEKASESIDNNPLAFLKMKLVFEDLAEEKQFSDKYLFFLNAIRKDGIAKVIKWTKSPSYRSTRDLIQNCQLILGHYIL